MKKIEFDKKYVSKKKVVHCPTEKLANEFLKEAHKHGYKWQSGHSYLEDNNWEFYKEETCYELFDESYADVDFYTRHGYEIVEFKGFKEEKKMDVSKWFELDESRRREDKVKYNIAVAVEGWLNGARDAGYDPMTKEEMEAYTYRSIQRCYTEAGWSTEDKGHVNSLHFYGKENTLKLIRQFINNYEDLQPYLIK